MRAEQRRGATWFELAHDRLLAPVRADNAAWFAEHLSTLQRQAALWRDQGKPDGLLLSAAALAEAEQWQAAQTNPLEPWETDFLAASKKAWKQAEQERRQNRLIRILAVVAGIVAAIAVAAAFIAYSQSVLAQRSEKLAQANELKAQANEQEALKQAGIAKTQSELARQNAEEAIKQAEIATTQSNLATARELAAAAVSNLNQDPELSILLAMQAITPTYTTEGEDALRQALQADRLRQRFGGGGEYIAKVAFDPTGKQLAAVTSGVNAGSRVALWPVLASDAPHKCGRLCPHGSAVGECTHLRCRRPWGGLQPRWEARGNCARRWQRAGLGCRHGRDESPADGLRSRPRRPAQRGAQCRL